MFADYDRVLSTHKEPYIFKMAAAGNRRAYPTMPEAILISSSMPST